MRSKPWKEHDTVRLRIIAERITAPACGKPKRIARWSEVNHRTGLHRLLLGHASKHREPGARRWRTVLRLKRRVATWYRRREL